MKKCNSCGTEQQNDTKFCSNCGQIFKNSETAQNGSKKTTTQKVKVNTHVKTQQGNTPPELTVAEKNQLERAYTRDIESMWREDTVCLISYNALKAFFIFVCCFSGINFFFADHFLWGIIAILGITFVGHLPVLRLKLVL